VSGPSKYDDLARELTMQLGADAVVLIVVGGVRGNGACPALRLSGDPARDLQLKAVLVRALRGLADGMERGTEPGHADWKRDVS